jgi:ribosomal protein S18 acetylase RimI-like enzyme
VEIRRAGPDDLDLVTPLFDAYRQFYDLPSNVAACRAYLGDRLVAGDSVVFVATDGRAALGFTQLYPTLDSLTLRPYAILSDLYVSPGARRRGTGRRLLGRAREYAEETGAVRLELQTASTNVAAQMLYASLGWCRDDQFVIYTLRCS